MVASRSVELPYNRSIARQRASGLGALAQVIGRTAIPFLRKNIVPVAHRVGADLMEIAAPEIATVVSGRRNFKIAAKRVKWQILKKQLGIGSKQRIVIPTKFTTQTSWSRRDNFTSILSLIMSNNF